MKIFGDGVFILKFCTERGASLALQFDNLSLNGNFIQSKYFYFVKFILVRRVAREVVKPPTMPTALFIKNLSFRITESDLEREFKRFNLVPNKIKI